MSGWLVTYEAPVRAAAFATTLGALYVLQRVRPCRGDGGGSSRQLINLALVGIDTAIVRIIFPVLTVGFAAAVAARGIGLFNVVAWPRAAEVVMAMLALDVVIYWQHRLLHRVPLLWRAHRVHHSDVAFDVTLGVRFHPFEIVLSQLVKLGAVAVLGAPPIAVVLFEVGLQAGSLFTHADLALSSALDGALRRWIVTPSVHRVHHSIERDETDSNFGFNLIWWDRLFGTYRAEPRRPEATMPIGIGEFRAPAEQRLGALLAQPFRSAIAAPPHAAPETRHA